MARPRLNTALNDPRVIRRRPTSIVDIYGHSQGGIAPQPEILNRPERQDFNEMNRYPNAYNDTLIDRQREYLFRRPNYYPPGDGGGNLNWTAAGPARDLPTFRFNRNIRPIVGGAHSNMWGQHTYLPTIGKNDLEGKSRMRPGKQNRLTVQRYRGQSYSATTKLAGQ